MGRPERRLEGRFSGEDPTGKNALLYVVQPVVFEKAGVNDYSNLLESLVLTGVVTRSRPNPGLWPDMREMASYERPLTGKRYPYR